MKTKTGRFGALQPKYLYPLCAVSSLLLLPGQLTAQTVNLSDSGSTATVDLTGGGGMNSWSVLGQNQLQQQWFWYSVNGGAVTPINMIGGMTYSTSGQNFLSVTYQNTQLKVNVQYSLNGGGVGSGNADISEALTINNISGADISNFNFYQYSHFNLLQSGNNSVNIVGSAGSYDAVAQNSGATALEETIDTPFATYAEAALYGQTLNNFNTIAGYNLDGVTSAGPGDVTWAFQWSQDLTAGGEMDINKDKLLSITPIPEPSTLGLIAVGAAAFGGRLLRRRK